MSQVPKHLYEIAGELENLFETRLLNSLQLNHHAQVPTSQKSSSNFKIIGKSAGKLAKEAMNWKAKEKAFLQRLARPKTEVSHCGEINYHHQRLHFVN